MLFLFLLVVLSLSSSFTASSRILTQQYILVLNSEVVDRSSQNYSSLDLWSNSAVSDKSATMSSTSTEGLARCLKNSAVEWVRLDWTAVSPVGGKAVRKACVANPEHHELFAGLPDGGIDDDDEPQP